MTSGASRGRPRGTTAHTVAQAKLNLFLRVLAREESGYHQLETLFCRLALGDDVTVRTGVSGRSLDCAGEAVPPDGLGPVERNLAWRAAGAFSEATGWPNDWAIEITKRIPVGGGLGGGSADAAAVLRCLNALAPQPLADDRLLSVAAALGADVPFLATDASLAVAWGRGDRILALQPLPARAVTLVCFAFGVSTPEAYAWIDAERGSMAAPATSRRLEDLTTWAGVAALAHNDFERVVAPRFPEIARVLAVLRGEAAADRDAFALVTGSGSTVALVSPSPADHAHAADGRLAGAALRLVSTRTAAAVVGVEVSG